MSSTLLTVVRVIRLGIFGLVSFFSIIVLGLGAHIVSALARYNADIPNFANNFGVQAPFGFAGLGIAVSLLSLFSLIPMLVLSFLDKVLWVNMVAVEVGWLGLLWVLWLATAALTNNDLALVVFGACDFTNTSLNCGELLGFQALSWLCWVLLFKYTIVLIALTIFQQVRGNHVWTAPVHQVNYFAPPAYPAGAPGVVYEQKTGPYPPQLPQQHTPQLPQQYPPQQPQQPGPMVYPPPVPGANYGTPTYQTPPPANPGYQA